MAGRINSQGFRNYHIFFFAAFRRRKKQRENAAACWKILPGDLGKPHVNAVRRNSYLPIFIFRSPTMKTMIYRKVISTNGA
jgi:hypothetical protein